MKKLPAQVLVLEIHPVNLLFFWLMSFFVKISVHRLHSACPGFFSARVNVLDMERYFTQNSAHCFRSQVLQQWENLLKKFPADSWNMRYGGHILDFTTKSKQALSGPFERLIMLMEIQNQETGSSRPYIADSMESRYLKRLDPSSGLFAYPTLSLISGINSILDGVFLYIWTSRQMIITLGELLSGYLHRDGGQRLPALSMPLIWNAIVPYELTLEPNRRSFAWIVDGKHFAKEDVLFILPRGAESSGFSSYLAHTMPELYRLVPRNILMKCIRDLTIVMMKHLLPLPRGLATMHKVGYQIKIAALKPIVQHYKPVSYVTSMRDFGVEDPSIVYLNAIGTKTVLYSFSASYHLPGDERCECDFRNIVFANLLVSHMVVWHKDFQEYIQAHPQGKTNIKVIGPLMVGDESVIALPQNDLRTRVGLSLCIERKDLWYISAFDVGPKSRSSRESMGFYPNYNTEEYMAGFLGDMYRLLLEFDRIVLVFKPLRSFDNLQNAYSKEFMETVQSIRDNPRGFILEDGIDPWIPIGIADTCIAVAYTVPPLAAMHHGIPGIFHDPTGFVHNRRNLAISHSVTHGYDQLSDNVQALMADGPTRDKDQKAAIWSKARDFVGECPGTSSSNRFREFLLETHER